MSIDLKKRIVDLSKKAAFAANKHGIEGQRAQVVLVLDISASMNALYKSGVVQRVIERMLGLAVSFDDDGQIDLLLFGTNAYPLPPVTLDEMTHDDVVAMFRSKMDAAALLHQLSAGHPVEQFVLYTGVRPDDEQFRQAAQFARG